MPAQPDKDLHANRRFSVPVSGSGGPKNCFSRGDILTGKTPAAFGSDQSMQICIDGESNPTELPRRWLQAGRVLRVPRTVILSSLPFWTCWWPSAYFYAPRDVIGEDLVTGEFGNYYYFDQWNDVNDASMTLPDYSFALNNSNYVGTPQQTTQYAAGDPNYLNNQVWKNFDSSLTTADKQTVYNMRSSCATVSTLPDDPDCDAIPSYLFNLCAQPPAERFSQIVCHVTNPYYQQHADLIKVFQEVKKKLEADPINPIFVIIPEWMPTELTQTRNAFLKGSHELLNGAHGGSANKKPCDVSDSIPCYNYVPVCWAPAYPDINAPQNQETFTTPGVPFLLSTHPGVGTDVLHLYIGHPCMKYSPSNSIWDFQAWPLTPEVQWIAGPVFQGTYLGSTLPFFAGRRAVWRDLGFDYGYTGTITPESLYETRYKPLVEAAVGTYKKEFYNYRNFSTHLFTYRNDWTFPWDFNQIWKDQENNCTSTQFFFGFNTFAEFAAQYDGVDTNISDCEDDGGPNPAKLKYGETHNNFPDTPSISAAVHNFFPPIAARIENYYNTIDTGSKAFYDLVIKKNDLEPYNVVSRGTVRNDFFDADGLIAYIQAYFAKELDQYLTNNP